jgi:hypothetical protein
MLESINTLLLTLSPSRDSDRADSLRPKELIVNCLSSLPYGLLVASSHGLAS